MELVPYMENNGIFLKIRKNSKVVDPLRLDWFIPGFSLSCLVVLVF